MKEIRESHEPQHVSRLRANASAEATATAFDQNAAALFAFARRVWKQENRKTESVYAAESKASAFGQAADHIRRLTKIPDPWPRTWRVRED